MTFTVNKTELLLGTKIITLEEYGLNLSIFFKSWLWTRQGHFLLPLVFRWHFLGLLWLTVPDFATLRCMLQHFEGGFLM